MLSRYDEVVPYGRHRRRRGLRMSSVRPQAVRTATATATATATTTAPRTTAPAPPVTRPHVPALTPQVTADSPQQDASGRRVGRRGARVLVEILLTVGALLGTGVTAGTVVAAKSGLSPLVVRSGSMEPTIPTGSMVLMKKIRADEIRVGDVVAVERPDHTRVTHRVLKVDHRGGAAELTLKGDANEDPDPVPVTVRSADRLVRQVPQVGRVAAWLATSQGGFVLGSLFTSVAMTLSRRRQRGSVVASHG